MKQRNRIRLTGNLSMKYKIMAPLVTLILIVAMYGTMALHGMSSLMQDTRDISNNYAVDLLQVSSVANEFSNMQRIVYEHCVAEDADSMNALETEKDETYNVIVEAVESLGTGLDSDAETEAYERFKAEFGNFTTIMNECISYSGEMKKEDAAALANTKLKESYQILTEALNDLAVANNEGLRQAAAASENTYKIGRRAAVTVLCIVAVIAVVSVAMYVLEIILPIKMVNNTLNTIVTEIEAGKGDLTKRIDLSGKDELSKMVENMNKFIIGLQGIIANVIKDSEQMDTIVNHVADNVSAANGSACDVSAVMEELSASMEEVSATAENINADAGVVSGHVAELAVESDSLAGYAVEMKNRASELEHNAVENKNNTSQVVEEILKKLKKAIEDSKSVEQINGLTNEILNISSQTNLLALNASIEAARAGDAGRGFAVVADEIRELADSSRETASNIQNINNLVTEAVKSLIDNSNQIIDYMNETILPDYEAFVASGQQYEDDASHVNEIVAQFNDMSGNLRDLVNNITEAIHGVVSAIEESSNGINVAATNTNELVKQVEEISDEMKNNQEVAKQLKSETAIFEKY